MEHVVNGLSDPVTKVQLAAVRCLHSLSRSVQQLRTSFQDHAVWKPLMKVLSVIDSFSESSILTFVEAQWLGGRMPNSQSREPGHESHTYNDVVDDDILWRCYATTRQNPCMILGNKL